MTIDKMNTVLIIGKYWFDIMVATSVTPFAKIAIIRAIIPKNIVASNVKKIIITNLLIRYCNVIIYVKCDIVNTLL